MSGRVVVSNPDVRLLTLDSAITLYMNLKMGEKRICVLMGCVLAVIQFGLL